MNYSERNLEKQMAKQRALTVFRSAERNRRRRLRRDYRKKREIMQDVLNFSHFNSRLVIARRTLEFVHF